MILDAHQHFWHYQPQRDTWISEDMQVLRRDFLPDDLLPLLKASGIDGCIAVQADSSLEETHFLLGLAAQYPWIAGVVGWVDLRANDLEAQLEALSPFEKLLGFRHIVQAEPDPAFLLRPEVIRGISLLGRQGYSYDVLVFPHQLPAVLDLVSLLPDQRFVLDHAAKPYLRSGHFRGWEANIRALAQSPNVSVKVSGLVTEADWQHWSYAQFLPVLDVLAETFGPNRLLYGSDWPVCLLAGEYARVKGVADQWTQGWSPEDKAAFWGGNAARVYRIGRNP